MTTTDFDYRGVWEAIESKRVARGLTKTKLIDDIAWVSAGVLNKLKDGHPTTCQHVTGLLRWLGRSPESFMPGITDKPEYALPDVGPYALRWSMPALWKAVDAQRELTGQTWKDVAEHFAWPGIKTFGEDIKYGIPMDLAMRITQWLGQPAATYTRRAEPAPHGVQSATWGTAL